MARKEIEANNRRFADALAEGDGARAASVYTSEAVVLPPGSEPIRGRNAIEAFWKAGIAMGIRACDLETLQLEERSDLAVEVGSYALRIEPEEGEALTDVGNYVVVHRQQAQGEWRWAVDIFNSNTRSS